MGALPTKIKLLTKAVTLGLLFCFVTSMQAQEDDASQDPQVRQLVQLVNDKEFETAFELSNQLLADWGGDPYFDFFAGRAAFALQRFEEAVFAFERVLVVNPELLTARVFLAFSYFKVNNLGAAQTELTKLLQEDLPEDDANQVREYLEQITEIKEKSVRSHDTKITVGYGYDSNVNSGTAAETIEFPIIGEIELLDSSRETEDDVVELAFSYVYKEKLTQKSGYNLGLTLSDISHKVEDQLDLSIGNLIAGYYDEWAGAKVNFSGYFQPMELDNEFYRIAVGSIADISWPISDKWSYTISLGFTFVDNKATDLQDIRQYTAKNRLTYFGESVHLLELGYGDDDAVLEEGKQNGKDFWLFNYSYIQPINPQWLLTLTAAYQDIKHDDINPAFELVRDEESYSAGLSLDYTPSARWRLSLRLNYTDKKSNIEIYEYDKSVAKILAIHTF